MQFVTFHFPDENDVNHVYPINKRLQQGTNIPWQQGTNIPIWQYDTEEFDKEKK